MRIRFKHWPGEVKPNDDFNIEKMTDNDDPVILAVESWDYTDGIGNNVTITIEGTRLTGAVGLDRGEVDVLCEALQAAKRDAWK